MLIADVYKTAGGVVEGKDGDKNTNKDRDKGKSGFKPFGHYLKDNTIKIEKMDPLESLVFKIKVQFSYTERRIFYESLSKNPIDDNATTNVEFIDKAIKNQVGNEEILKTKKKVKWKIK